VTGILGLTRRDLVVIGAVIFALLCAGVVTVRIIIDTEVNRVSARAQAEFPGDRLDALIAVAESPRHSLAFRNHAVWALGQAGDARAIEPLQRLLTGGPCDHERFVCQREVRKSLSLCSPRSWRARLKALLRWVTPAEE